MSDERSVKDIAKDSRKAAAIVRRDSSSMEDMIKADTSARTNQAAYKTVREVADKKYAADADRYTNHLKSRQADFNSRLGKNK